MNCEQIRDQLVETARGRELSSDLRAIVFAHAAECAACARRLDWEQRLTGTLASLSERAGGAPSHIEQALRRQLSVVPIRRKQPPRYIWAGAGAAAIAAALTAVFLIPSQHSSAKPAGLLAGAHSALTAPVLTAKAEPAALPSPRPASVRTARRAPAVTSSVADDTGGFVPLPYADAIDATEQTSTVRVEMSRESLLTMGFSMNPDDLNGSVQADVVFGMDGTPRAIRIAD